MNGFININLKNIKENESTEYLFLYIIKILNYQ